MHVCKLLRKNIMKNHVKSIFGHFKLKSYPKIKSNTSNFQRANMFTNFTGNSIFFLCDSLAEFLLNSSLLHNGVTHKLCGQFFEHFLLSLWTILRYVRLTFLVVLWTFAIWQNPSPWHAHMVYECPQMK